MHSAGSNTHVMLQKAAVIASYNQPMNSSLPTFREATGEITLKKGSTRQKFHLRPLENADKPQILKAYLDSFKREVQRYFPVAAGSPPEAFAQVASSYPAFELLTI